MNYRKFHVGYFGKKGMSMLRTILVQQKPRSSIHLGEENIFQGFEYTFENYVFNGCASQDHEQVASSNQYYCKKG